MQKTDYCDNSLLLKKHRDGDKNALEELCKSNSGLVTGIAKRFCGRGHEYEDLIEVGKIGLLKAIDGFDESLGYSFSTYAFPLILGEIKRFLRDDGPIKISRKVKANAKTVISAREEFYKQNKREAKLSELSEITHLTFSEITEALESQNCIVSLEEKVSSRQDTSLRICDTIPDGDFLETVTDRIALSQAISKLNEEEKQLITLRFFKNMTQTSVSKILGISQVTVSRLEKKIIDKLRQDFL
ncbi:MAG: sigma-70 family RNA polymerase sigma factor [Ruminococcaceae bacterium]|nr:sigma-70 family RNA polymerase sigma factor [Oscillospiraceae bacterium]